jgi:hypothetical protein
VPAANPSANALVHRSARAILEEGFALTLSLVIVYDINQALRQDEDEFGRPRAVRFCAQATTAVRRSEPMGAIDNREPARGRCTM